MLLVENFDPFLYAQGVLAEVHGIVTHASGTVIPGATITVIDISKGWTRVLHSNGDGMYALPQLEPDMISISVETPNFNRQEQLEE